MSAPVHVLLVDNFDSFSFNLVDELAKRGCPVEVVRNDLPAAEVLARVRALAPPRLLVLSPGPGTPADAGCTEALVREAGTLPTFGVCLGLQAMVTGLGGAVGGAGEIVHGKASRVEHDGLGLFEGLPCPLTVGRYHSLVAHRLPPELARTAWLGDLMMAAAHRTRPLVGVQFHPESVLTPGGGRIFENLLAWARRQDPAEDTP